MSVAVAPHLMTSEEWLALPDDGVSRWLVNGRLREFPPRPGEPPMTRRNRWHSRVMVRVSYFLEHWLDLQPEPRGSVLCGEVGVRLRREPDTTVGVDVIYIAPELAAHEPEETTLVDGVPVLAVEILSPNTTQQELDEKVALYLQTGVRLVWVIHPRLRTVLVLRPDAPPTLVNDQQELTGEPHLPGFRVPVAQIFA